MRHLMCAITAAALAAWRVLPDRVSVLVQPLMAGLRHLPTQCLHAQVLLSLTIHASCVTPALVTPEWSHWPRGAFLQP